MSDTHRHQGTIGSPGVKVDRRGSLAAIDRRQREADRLFPIRRGIPRRKQIQEEKR